jgi:NAD+ kinase
MVHPQVPCILFTPICPHSLSFRPLMFPDHGACARGRGQAHGGGRHATARPEQPVSASLTAPASSHATLPPCPPSSHPPVVLCIRVPTGIRSQVWCSFDGKERTELHPGDAVLIRLSKWPLPTVTSTGDSSTDWFSSVRSNLGWNARKLQNAAGQ